MASIAAKLVCRENNTLSNSLLIVLAKALKRFSKRLTGGAKQQPLKSFKVNISQHELQLEAHALAVIEHHGDPTLLPNTMAKFLAWRQQHGLSPSVSRSLI